MIDKEPPSAFEGEGGDTTTLFVGDSGCGKSTLINSFLKPNVSKEPKPTFALDYNFARRKASAAKSVAHIWELGGDINEPRLLEVPLTPSALAFTSVVVVCDLSKPQNCLASVLKWVKRVQDVVSLRLRDLQSTDKPAADKVKETAEKKYRGHAGADDKRVRPCEVPLYIVANKYDKFREVPPVWQPFGGSPTWCSSPVMSCHLTVACRLQVALADRRSLVQVLRFVAHYHGATLVTTSCVDAALKDSFRSFMSGIWCVLCPRIAPT